MHGYDNDHYDVQFSTRQVVLLFGLLTVIVVGVFVGGIVIGRGMGPSAGEALMARRAAPAPAPARTAAAQPPALTEAPSAETLRLPIPSEPREPARTAERSPARPAPAAVAPAPRAAAAAPAPAPRTASTSPEQLSNRTLAARRRLAAPTPEPARPAARPRAAGAATFTIQVAAFRDRSAAERMLKQLAESGIEGYLEGTPGGIFRVRVGRFESREAARELATRLESEKFATLVTSR